MADDKPIIIIKKKGGHGGHHGGAWKIAYADFVTAMMAFFMVMWLVNTADAPTKKNIASYFRKPGIFDAGSGAPINTGNVGILTDAYVATRPDEELFSFGKSTEYRDGKLDADGGEQKELLAAKTEEGDGFVRGIKTTGISQDASIDVIIEELKAGKGESMGAAEVESLERMMFSRLSQQIQQALISSPEIQDLIGIVDMKMDADGLNIEIMDSDKSSMFRSGSSSILPEAKSAFEKIGAMLARLPNSIDIVGHTDARPFSNRSRGYSNWELSSDRAHTARRLLEAQGIDPSRITHVMGRADKDLKIPEDPFNSANRRITLKLRFSQKLPGQTIVGAPKPEVIKQLEKEAHLQQEQREKIHSFTVKEILERKKKKDGEPVKLPESNPVPTQNPPHMPKDLIFGDSPIIGPKEPF